MPMVIPLLRRRLSEMPELLCWFLPVLLFVKFVPLGGELAIGGNESLRSFMIMSF